MVRNYRHRDKSEHGKLYKNNVSKQNFVQDMENTKRPVVLRK